MEYPLPRAAAYWRALPASQARRTAADSTKSPTVGHALPLPCNAPYLESLQHRFRCNDPSESGVSRMLTTSTRAAMEVGSPFRGVQRPQDCPQTPAPERTAPRGRKNVHRRLPARPEVAARLGPADKTRTSGNLAPCRVLLTSDGSASPPAGCVREAGPPNALRRGGGRARALDPRPRPRSLVALAAKRPHHLAAPCSQLQYPAARRRRLPEPSRSV